jgi:hypothetical protein
MCECKENVCCGEEEIEQEVMTARMWIEYGKMHNNLVMEGEDVSISNELNDDGNDVYLNSYTDTEHPNPYLAMKEIYFMLYLEKEDCVDFALCLDDATTRELYSVADQRGIIVDELVVEILDNFIECL